MPMVVVEMHCTCGAHERVVTSEFALPMRRAQLRAITKVTVMRSTSTSTTGSLASLTERDANYL